MALPLAGMAKGPAQALSFQSQAADDEVNATINTTPLVDVMLVLLIIFLITVPAIIPSVALELPRQRQVPREVQLNSVEISVQRDGALFWNGEPLSEPALLARLKTLSAQTPPPEVHLRGDAQARFASVRRVVQACQQAGIGKLNFVTEPPPRQ